MIPFPFLQWLTATCGRCQQSDGADSKGGRGTYSVLLLAKALHRLAHIGTVECDAGVETFAENAPDEAPYHML
jgi:hypothetical protein